MSRLVSGVVTAARDRHRSFDQERQPPGPIYRYLADYCQELQNKVLGFLPDYLQVETTTTVALPLADFSAGITLAPARLLTEVVAVDPASAVEQLEYEVTIIAEEARFAINQPALHCWQTGDTIFLRGPADRWSSFGSIELSSAPAFGDVDIAALQLPAAVLPLPDAAAGAVSAKLAAFMADRSEGLDEQIVGRFNARADEAEAAFMSHVLDRLQGTTFTVLDVYRP